MKARFRSEADDWTDQGSKITEPDKLDAIRETLENRGSVIVQHWFYRGASAPDRRIFDEYEDFTTWLENETFAGDAIDVWNMADVCLNENLLAEGKCPDEEGLIPRRGAY